MACAELVYETKVTRSLLQALFPKLTILFEAVPVMCIYFTRMYLSNF